MSLNVAIVGAAGDTGTSIVNALLASTTTNFNITALTRPSPTIKPALLALQKRGVRLLPADLTGATPDEDLAKLLTGIDIVIATINIPDLGVQIPLANAAKLAGVKRFVPCFFGTIVPPKGVLGIREMKENTLSHLKKIYLPYTAIDVGWWFQIFLPRLPSGRGHYTIDMGLLPQDLLEVIANEGDVMSAVTDLRDIGVAVERIIADERTVNAHVFVWGEMRAQEEGYKIMEGVSGEVVPRKRLSTQEIQTVIDSYPDQLAVDNKLIWYQYLHSWGVRGDNTPEKAKFLRYLDAKELYPDIKWRTLEDCAKEIVHGPGVAA